MGSFAVGELPKTFYNNRGQLLTESGYSIYRYLLVLQLVTRASGTQTPSGTITWNMATLVVLRLQILYVYLVLEHRYCICNLHTICVGSGTTHAHCLLWRRR